MGILNKGSGIMYYVNIFFIYSFLGFCFENILNIFTHSYFNSGILYGPWTFIYAFAIFAIMLVDKLLKRLKLKKGIEVLLFYIIITIVITLIEFSGGMLIEKLMHRVYWDYTNMTFNYGHYITLEVALFWGIFAIIINYLVRPFLSKFALKIPYYVTVILGIFFVIDVVATIVN